MKKIKLNETKSALVDDADFEWLSQWRWSATGCNCRYAGRHSRQEGKVVYMHRLIINAPDGMAVDHIDGNPLNNQRSNLRLATPGQNCGNQGIRKNNKSGYKGVYQVRKRYTARMRNRYLGTYSTKEEAARVYDAAARQHWGQFARTNFPNGNIQP